MIKDLILEHNIKVSEENNINLGCANGWDKSTNEFFKKMRAFIVPDSGYGRNLGRCYNGYGAKYQDIDGTIYSVDYSVDSSD